MNLHDHPAEFALLGLVSRLSERSPEQALALLDGLNLVPADFARAGIPAIWQAMRAILARGHAIGTLGLADELLAQGARVKLHEVMDSAEDRRAISAGEAPALAGRIRELARRRRMAEVAERLQAAAHNATETPEDSALTISAELVQLGTAGEQPDPTLQDALFEYLGRMDEIRAGTRIATVPTGIEIWDELLGGLQAGVVTFIGAQPSVGKSALIGSMARNIAKAGHVVGVFSLEDSRDWLVERTLAWESGIPVRRLVTADVRGHEASDFAAAGERVHDWASRMIIDDRNRLTAQQVAAKARHWVASRGARAIIVDHLGELDLDGGKHDRHDLAVTSAVACLRDVAKDLNVPVVVCAHFARPPKSNDEPRYQRPTSSSWANSSGVERMARVAVGLWLPKPEEGAPPSDEIVCTVLKQTRGDKDFDFAVLLDRPSGLVRTAGGRRREKGAAGHHEYERKGARS